MVLFFLYCTIAREYTYTQIPTQPMFDTMWYATPILLYHLVMNIFQGIPKFVSNQIACLGCHGFDLLWLHVFLRLDTHPHHLPSSLSLSSSRPLAPQAMADAATLWALHGYLKPLNTPASSAFLSPRVCVRSSWEVCEKQSGMGCLNDWVNVFTFICFKHTLVSFFTSIFLFRSLMGLLKGFMHICFGTPCWWSFVTTALTTFLKYIHLVDNTASLKHSALKQSLR